MEDMIRDKSDLESHNERAGLSEDIPNDAERTRRIFDETRQAREKRIDNERRGMMNYGDEAREDLIQGPI